MNFAAHLPAVRIGVPLLGDYDLVAARMRADEREQWLATTGALMYHLGDCARSLVAQPGPAFVLVDRSNLPLMLGGFEPIRPGVERGWMAAVDGSWEAHWFPMTREVRRLCRQRFDEGVHRIEAIALASRTRTAAWFERGLGMTFEGTLRGYFADARDAALYSLTPEDC